MSSFVINILIFLVGFIVGRFLTSRLKRVDDREIENDETDRLEEEIENDETNKLRQEIELWETSYNDIANSKKELMCKIDEENKIINDLKKNQEAIEKAYNQLNSIKKPHVGRVETPNVGIEDVTELLCPNCGAKIVVTSTKRPIKYRCNDCGHSGSLRY